MIKKFLFILLLLVIVFACGKESKLFYVGRITDIQKLKVGYLFELDSDIKILIYKNIYFDGSIKTGQYLYRCTDGFYMVLDEDLREEKYFKKIRGAT